MLPHTFADDKLGTLGTGLQGYIDDVPYEALVKIFGEPNGETDGYKIDALWILRTPVGVATIYNYKTGKNYLGKEGIPVKEIKNWNVGGARRAVVLYVVETITNWLKGTLVLNEEEAKKELKKLLTK